MWSCKSTAIENSNYCPTLGQKKRAAIFQIKIVQLWLQRNIPAATANIKKNLTKKIPHGGVL